MILYTGGKYQGKTKCILDDGKYNEADFFDFSRINSIEYANSGIDYREKKVWLNIDEYVRSLALSGTELNAVVMTVKGLMKNCKPEIITVAEVGAGIIPINKSENVFREACGRLSVELAESADEVYRVICGIKMKIK